MQKLVGLQLSGRVGFEYAGLKDVDMAFIVTREAPGGRQSPGVTFVSGEMWVRRPKGWWRFDEADRLSDATWCIVRVSNLRLTNIVWQHDEMGSALASLQGNPDHATSVTIAPAGHPSGFQALVPGEPLDLTQAVRRLPTVQVQCDNCTIIAVSAEGKTYRVNPVQLPGYRGFYRTLVSGVTLRQGVYTVQRPWREANGGTHGGPDNARFPNVKARSLSVALARAFPHDEIHRRYNS